MRTQEVLPLWDARRSGIRVFCLPHAGGGASAYRKLARDLRPLVDLQPVQLPGREGFPVPLMDNAADVVELLGTSIEPLLDEPYVIAGHSMGGLLAAELTAWLARRGRPLPRLLVVSSHTGDFREDRMAGRELTDDELVAELTQLGGTAAEVLRYPEMRAIVLEIMRNDLRLVRRYRPTFDTLDVPILAVAGDQDAEVPAAGVAAWRQRTTRACSTEILPGGHFALFQHPERIAALITEGARCPEDVILDILRARLDDDSLTLDDDFYAAGGDSMVALGVIADARERGLTVRLRDLLTCSVMREIVPSADEHAAAETALTPFTALSDADRALVPDGVVDAYPASSLQVGLIFLCELAGDASLYNDLVGLRVRTPFREREFRAALDTLTQRHPCLRASFDLATFSTGVQLVWERARPRVEIESGDADPLVRAFRERQLTTGIDWSAPPAFACHVAVEPDSFRLTVAIHHAIIDGWSLARLLVELLTCYDAELRGTTATLPPVPADGHRRFVELERAASGSAAFWRAEADVPPLLLPDRPEGIVPDPTESRHLPIDPATMDRLRHCADRFGVPLKSLFLAIHGRSLAVATGRDGDVVTGLVTNGRPEVPGADHLVGLFLNTVPVRLRSTAGSWAEQACRAWETEQNLLAHRRFPISAIEQELGRPAFDVSFNFIHFHSYRELDDLALGVDSWWSYDKASFPLGVEVVVDSAELGTRVIVTFDPALVPGDVVDAYVDSLRFALDSVAEPVPVAGA